MSYQRKRGQKIVFYPTKEVRNNRGDLIKIADRENAWHTTAAESSDRTSRIEIPGQGGIDVVRVIVSSAKPMTLFGKAFFRDQWWDITAPPQYRHGTRQVRHQSVLLRNAPAPHPEFYDG